MHDLGAALCFGGAAMGVAGVITSGKDLGDPRDEVRVAESAWQRFATNTAGRGPAAPRPRWRSPAPQPPPSAACSGQRIGQAELATWQ